MKGMFLNCINLKNINLLSFDAKNVVNKSDMFKNYESLQNNLDLSSFDYNSVIKMKNTIEILSSDYANFDLSFKIIIIGDSDSGKSKLVAFGTKVIFEENYSPTIGFEFKTFNVRIKDKIIRL